MREQLHQREAECVCHCPKKIGQKERGGVAQKAIPNEELEGEITKRRREW
jgi:hypothetical protein